MPLIVTDADVLAQIATDDGHAASLDAQIGAMSTRVPVEVQGAWTKFLEGYRAWAETSKKALSGGVLFGAWFGVPAMGNQAAAYGTELAQWQDAINAIDAGKAAAIPAAVDPNAVATANAEIAGVNAPAKGGLLAAPSAGTVILVGAGAAVALAFLLSRRL
jgi:hypothetical protein